MGTSKAVAPSQRVATAQLQQTPAGCECGYSMTSSSHFSKELKNLGFYVKDIDFLKLVFTFKSIETLGCMA